MDRWNILMSDEHADSDGQPPLSPTSEQYELTELDLGDLQRLEKAYPEEVQAIRELISQVH